MNFDTSHVRFIGSIAVEGAIVSVVVEKAVSLARIESGDNGINRRVGNGGGWQSFVLVGVVW